MKVRMRCKTLEVFKIPGDFDMFTRSFDFLSLGYSKVLENHFAYLNFLGFQVSIEWGYGDI